MIAALSRRLARPGRRAAATLMAGVAACASMPLAWAAVTVLPVPDARQWLLRMHNAATQRNYQGTLVIMADGSVTSSRVVHYCEGSQSYERIEMLDGQPRRVLRQNDQLLTLWPATRLARLEQREPVQPFPNLLSGSDEHLFERYDMLSEGSGRIAGHEAAVFMLRPRDDARFAQRLWADQGTGLLLRVDVLAPDGRVLESSAFTDLSIGGKARLEPLQTVLKQLSGWRVLKPEAQRTSLEAQGWRLKVPVPGFVASGGLKRQLDAPSPGAASAAGAGDEVLQAVFTDGLTHVSLFIEPLRADRPRSASSVSGATHTWMQTVGAHSVTAVGDVPLATLKKFAAALERTAR